MPYLNVTTAVIVNVEDSGRRWNYDPWALLEVYAPALVAVLAVMVYGLFCTHANGRVTDNKFPTLLLTMRSEELDGLYAAATDFDALLDKKLLYVKQSHFIPDPREYS